MIFIVFNIKYNPLYVACTELAQSKLKYLTLKVY